MSPPRVKRMSLSCNFDSNNGRGPHGDDEKEEMWSLTYTTSSLEYSSSLDYSDNDSIVEDAVIADLTEHRVK